MIWPAIWPWVLVAVLRHHSWRRWINRTAADNARCWAGWSRKNGCWCRRCEPWELADVVDNPWVRIR